MFSKRRSPSQSVKGNRRNLQGRMDKLCPRLQRECRVRRWGADGRGKGHAAILFTFDDEKLKQD